MDDILVATDAWRSAFPGACVGVLVMRDVSNPAESPALEEEKRKLEKVLRHRAQAVGGEGVNTNPAVRAYADYYRSHGKTYHVKAQWESVAAKGKAIPTRAALVEAMFMAELKNLMLTAGHDLAKVALPVCIDITREGGVYTLMNGSERRVGAGDMMIRDCAGILSTILHGPNRRTALAPGTRDALFAVYAPAGIGEEAVRNHLDDIRANVLLIAPETRVEQIAVVSAEADEPTSASQS